MSASMETTRARITTPDGTVMEFAYRVECSDGSENTVWSVCYINGVEVGDPVRYHASANRIAADFPGVSGNYFITDGNGKITNG